VISITCHLARIGAGIAVPREVKDPHFLAEIYKRYSAGDINLVVDNSQLATSIDSSNLEPQAYDLHVALGQVTRNETRVNQLANPPAVHSVGVILANRYSGCPGALGVMFDRGFETSSDDPSGSHIFTGVPREGCAVFLSTIRDLRPQQADFERETRFTTVHELGHIFNLLHNFGSSPTFMSISQRAQPYDDRAFVFSDDEKDHLARCSTSPDVWPGGLPFDDRTDEARYDDPFAADRIPHEFGVEMLIGMEQREFWRFEPVELDLIVRTAPGVSRSFKMPNTFDPGYENFVIWIEEPNGEMRRYRSPHRYCPTPSTIDIAQSQPFQRDIPIFGQSGGYTFRRSGPHKIWTTMVVPGRGMLRSNQLEINVRRAPQRESQDSLKLRETLTKSPIGRLLFYRLDRTGGKAESELAKLVESEPEIDSLAQIRYVLGRAQLERATRQKNAAQRKALLRSAATHLTAAADAASLGNHRRGKIFALAEKHDLKGLRA
jgi:hypothetical protein